MSLSTPRFSTHLFDIQSDNTQKADSLPATLTLVVSKYAAYANCHRPRETSHPLGKVLPMNHDIGFRECDNMDLDAVQSVNDICARMQKLGMHLLALMNDYPELRQNDPIPEREHFNRLAIRALVTE
jgi:hypothetical protein